MALQVFFLVLSLVLLYYGAEIALENAEKIGKAFGMSNLTIGLIIIGFGTSLPEFFVSHLASFRGVDSIALGNIIGSNIANTYLILGVSALLVPLYLQHHSIRKMLVLQLLVTCMLAGAVAYGKLDRITVTCFVLFFLYFLYVTFNQLKEEEEGHEEHEEEKAELSFRMIFKLLVGFTLLYGSGELLVSSGSKLGIMLGISPYIISAIFVAFGTSLPELVTAMLACIKKKDIDLISGNIIGSNIFNISFVLGTLGLHGVSFNGDRSVVEMICLIGSTIFLLFFSMTRHRFYRLVGSLFLSIYGGVVYYWVFHRA